MNIEAAVSIQAVRGPKMVRGSAAGNVGELEHHVAPEKCASPARSRIPPSRRNRTGQCPLRAPISPDATERQSAPTELTVAGGPKVRILLAPAESQGELHELAMTRNRWFESISLQERVERTAIACPQPIAE